MPKTTNKQPLFIHVAKAAGQTIWESLELRRLAPRICESRRHGTLNYLQSRAFIERSGTRMVCRKKGVSGEFDGLADDLDKYWIIGSVRNPWKRIVSLYRWTHKSRKRRTRVGAEAHDLDFKTWLHHKKPPVSDHYKDFARPESSPLQQVNYFIDKEGEIRYDEIIRAEYLEDDIQKSPFYVGKITLMNVCGTSKGWTEMYDDEDIEYVREQSLWEIEKFGYKFRDKYE